MAELDGGITVRLVGNQVQLVVRYGDKEAALEVSLEGAEHMADLLVRAVRLAEEQAVQVEG